MRYILFFTILILAVPVNADDAVSPMPPDARAEFDKELAKTWHIDCACYRFLFEGKVKEIKPPISDRDRWLILRVITDGAAIPLGPSGQTN